MELRNINIQQYSEFLNTQHEKDFLQSDFEARKLSKDGWEVEFIEAYQGNERVAVSMLAYIPLMKVFKYCYIPRGFFIDYHNKEVMQEFTSLLQAYLKKKNVVYAEMDPPIILHERDKNGDLVDGGIDNMDVVENLKSAGFVQLPLKRGYDISKECRWVSVLNVKDKSADEIFSEFSYQTRQDVRSQKKYCVKTRELNESELNILDTMEQETSQRQDFEAMTLDYYKELYKFFGKEHVKTVYSYLDLAEYSVKMQSEFDKTQKDIEKTKAFLQQNPNSVKKEKRLKTDEEYYNSLKKKLNQIDSLKKQYGNEVPLACCLFIKYGHQIVYLVGSSNYEQRVFRGPYAIQWKMIQEACNEGYDLYNFYGISGLFEKDDEGYGVFDYKRGYNAVVQEYIGNFVLPCKKETFNFYTKLKHMC